MAKKTKKRISVTAFEKVMKETYQPAVEFEWNGLTVDVKRTLSLAEMMGFITGVIDVCYNAETGVYTPEIKNCAIRLLTLENYANFTMPSNTEKIYELIYCTDAFDCVLSHVNQIQFREMCDIIDEKLDYITSASIEAANKHISDIFNSLEGLQEQISSVFGDVSEEDFKGLIGALTNGKLEESKLMKAYFEEKPAEAEAPKVIPMMTE